MMFASKQEPPKQEAPKQEVKKDKESPKEDAADTTKKAEQKKAGDSSTSSSDEEQEAATELTKDDIDKIKKLIADQDKEIETLKGEAKSYNEKLIYQLAENDNTIKRYKKEIDQTRDFAITKFAKDLLEVRDTLQLASDHIQKIKLEEVKDIEELKKQFQQISKGMSMTSHVMDNCLKRFGVV